METSALNLCTCARVQRAKEEFQLMLRDEIHTIRKALKLISHGDSHIRNRALAAERALDAIEQALAAWNEQSPPPEVQAPKARN